MPIPDHIGFIDIESLPGDATVGMDLSTAPGWEQPCWQDRVEMQYPKTAPSNYKDPKKIALWQAKENDRYAQAVVAAGVKAQEAVAAERNAAAKAWRGGSLSAFRGRIACIAVAFGEDEVHVIDCAEDEEAGLRELGNIAVPVAGRWVAWVGHNGFRFDFPFIQIRALKYGSTVLAGRFHQEKTWDGKLFDTADWWPSLGGWSGSRSGTKLGDICAHLGIDHGADNPIDGSQVLDAYVEGRWGDVVAHAKADVRDLREVYRVLKAVRS